MSAMTATPPPKDPAREDADAASPLARSLAGEVRGALQSFARTLQDTPHFDPTNTVRRFTIGMRDALESTLLPPLMARVTAMAPHVEIAAIPARARFQRLRREGGYGRLLSIAPEIDPGGVLGGVALADPRHAEVQRPASSRSTTMVEPW